MYTFQQRHIGKALGGVYFDTDIAIRLLMTVYFDVDTGTVPCDVYFDRSMTMRPT